MPLIYNNSTGQITEGPIPEGGTKVIALFEGRLVEVFVAAGNNQPPVVVSGGEVTDERLTYDNYEKAKKAIESAFVEGNVSETAKKAIETVTAAFAAEITETGRKAREAVFVASSVLEQAKKAVDATSVVGQVLEKGKRADDTIQAFIIPTAEQARKAREGINNEVTAIVPELGKRATDSVASVAAISEQGNKATEAVSADFTVSEVAKKASEDISNTVTAPINETGKRATESIAGIIIPQIETGARATDTQVVEITLNGYANQNVQNTGWTNQGNILGNTTNTSASLTATSSGLLGTTNNTTNGTTRFAFRDVNLGDLTIASVILSAENSGARAGVAIVRPTVNIQYQYSLNNGGTWTTFYNHTTTNLGKGIRTVDITTIVGQDQALLSALQIRATGTVTSGTGIGAAYTASFFRCWMTVLANRTYV